MKIKKLFTLIFISIISSSICLQVCAEGSLYGVRHTEPALEYHLLTEAKLRGADATIIADDVRESLDIIFNTETEAQIFTDESGTITRERLAKSIVNRLTCEGYKLNYTFEDIWFFDAEYFYENGYEQARSLHRMGIMTAFDDGYFYPNNPISAGEAEIIFLRLANYLQNSISALASLPVSTTERHDAADDSWFDDVCFIGHSQVVGYHNYRSNLYPDDPIDYYSVIGFTAQNVLDYEYFELPDGRYGTLREGLESNNYGKVYIMLGINDAPEIDKIEETFIIPMKKILDLVKETQPNARIYMLSLTPVGEWTPNNEWFNPERAVRYSQEIKKLSRLYGTQYLDIYRLMSNSEGYYLPEFNSGDGIHMQPASYSYYEEYIRTHT